MNAYPVAIITTLLFSLLLFTFCDSNKTVIQLGGLINEISELGLRNKMAMDIAVQYLNELPPVGSVHVVFNMTVLSTDSMEEMAIEQTRRLVTEYQVVGVVGPFYSRESIPVSQQVANVYQIPLISYFSTSDMLSNSTAHPYFMRVVPPNHAQAETLVDFIYMMEWKDITLFHSNEAYGSDAVFQVGKLAELKRVQIIETDGFDDEEQIDAKLMKFKQSGRKIFVCFIAEFSDISYLIRAAHNMSMMTEDYVWVFSETFQSGVFQNKDSVGIDQALSGIANGIIYVEMGTNFWTKQSYLLESWKNKTQTYILDQLIPFVYDAVLCYGFALREMVAKGENIHSGQQVKAAVIRQDFLGSSGRLKFAPTESSRERIGSTFNIVNLVESNVKNTTIKTIATWDYENSLEILKDANGRSRLVLPGNVEIDMASEHPTSLTVSNNLQWRPLPKFNNPPSKRHSFSAAVDEETDTLLLFGGTNAIQVLSDFFSFSFKENMWSQILPLSTKPPARKDAAGFIINHEFYLFGGFDDSILYNDLWVFNFEMHEWRSITKKKVWPTPRRTGRVAVSNGVAYLFGGQTKNGATNDMWRLDPVNEEWILEEPDQSYSVPGGIRDHCFVASMDYLILFSGKADDQSEGSNDLWIYNVPLKRWTQQQTMNSPAVRFSAMCAITGNTLFIGQGWRDSINAEPDQYNDLYSVEIDFTKSQQTWTQLLSEADLLAVGHSGRDSSFGLIYQNYLLWIGGWGSADILNDVWRYTTTDDKLRLVHNIVFSPSGLARHSAVLVGNNAIIFGGINSKLSPTSDLYEFNLDTEEWMTIIPSGALPRPRYDHAAAVIEDQMYVFGGRNEDEYFGDLWVYSHTMRSWRQILFHGDFPSPRAAHTAEVVSNAQYVLVYGGTSSTTLFNDLWFFNIAEEQWTQIDYNFTTFAPFPLGLTSTSFAGNILLASGSDEVQTPDHAVYLFNSKTNTFSEFAGLDFSNSRTKSTVTSISDQYALLFGGNIYNELSNAVVKVMANKTEMMDLSSSFNFPGGRDQHSALFYGNKYVIMGGTKAVTGTRFRNNQFVSNDVWMLRIGPVCRGNSTSSDNCYKCSTGTYEYRSQCLSCPQGYYSDKPGMPKCSPCPRGFFGTFPGATSLNFCYPCMAGTFNDKEGQNQCTPCPNNMFCPLGSVTPLDKSYLQTAMNTIPSLKQPISATGNNKSNTLITRLTFVSIGAISAILLVFWLITRRCLKKVYTYMDVLFDSHHNIHQGPMMRKRNSFGGIASLIGILFCVALLVNLAVPYANDNALETRSLIPNLSVSRTVVADITASITLLDYAGVCTTGNMTCSPNIKAFSTGSQDSYEFYSCQESVNMSLPIFNRNCTVTLTCQNCRFASAEMLALQFQARELNTYTKGFYWSVTANSGYPDQHSSISAFLKAEEGVLFRGILTPSIVSLNGIQTIHTNNMQRRPVNQTGLHLDYSSVSPGETTQWQSFSHKNGVDFRFNIHRSSSSLEVIISPKKSWTDFIGAVLGGLAGLVGLMGKVVQFLEKSNERIRRVGKKVVLVTSSAEDVNTPNPIIIRKGSKMVKRQRRDSEMPDLPTEITTSYTKLTEEDV